MKTQILTFVALIFALGLVMLTGCKREEEEPPAMVGLTIAADNATASVVFSEAVYKMDNRTGNLDQNSFNVTLTGGQATLTGFTVEHTAGTAQATIALELAGVATGQETLTVTPKGGAAIFNADGVAMDVYQTLSVNLNELGIIGNWYSSGANVALLLSAVGIDSIYVEFNADNSYLVEAFTADGSKTTMEGIYTQTRSTVTGIWNIVLNQSTPTTLRSEGIFEVIHGQPVTMRYEVAQVDPVIPGVTPPTAVAGFGSTSAGAYGTWNIQNYIKLN